MRDISVQEFLASLGYYGEDADAARAVLAGAGLARMGKQRIAKNKLARASVTLGTAFFRSCTAEACRDAASSMARRSGKRLVTVPRTHCEVCEGSDNARAVRDMTQAMHRHGKRRLLVVGGMAGAQSELTRLLPSGYEVRFIGDDANKTAKDAAQDAGWADFIVIWASTPIGHKTSELYKPFKPLTVSRRSVAALAGEVALSLRGRR